MISLMEYLKKQTKNKINAQTKPEPENKNPHKQREQRSSDQEGGDEAEGKVLEGVGCLVMDGN